jgi:hypothetical protein
MLVMFYKGKHERRPRRRRGTRMIVGFALISLLAAVLPSASTFSAFSYTTPNNGNTGTAGTVALTDNDAGTAMLVMTNAKPGDTDTSCIQVTSTGTLPSLVKLYGTTTGTGLDAYLNLVVTRGTGAAAFDDCTGFTADATNYAGLGAGVLYNGTLTGYADTYAAGLADPRTATIPEAWTTGEAHTYKLQLTVADNNAAQTLNVTQAFTWEARNTTLYSQVVMSDQPASYWKLDEAAGTTATDAMGLANGTYTSGPTLNQIPSALKDTGTSIRFADVSADKIVVSDVHDFAGNASFSVELWMQPTAVNGYWRRVIAKEGGGGWEMLLGAQGTGMSNYAIFTRDGSTKDDITSGFSLVAGTWYHVVTTYDGTNLRMYINGTLRSTLASSGTLPNHAFALTIGDVGSGGGDGFGGGMDEVALYNTTLSQQQVTEHYNAGKR